MFCMLDFLEKKKMRVAMKNLMLCVLFLIGVLAVKKSYGANVTYDHRALVIDGNRRVLISGAIHYPRSTPEMWPDLIRKSKDGGLDVIETYVFWDLHEPVQHQYDFKGRKDLVKFVKLVADAGIYVHLRIGPYVCAEWNYGGFPLWLHFIPEISFRTDNEPFKAEMQRFTAKIVDMMKQEKLFASQGGPIIMSQIENEYGNVESEYGPAGKSYINWAANMAASLDTGVPWNMCQQPDAPDPMINTCNGFYCDQFTPNANNKPKMWTENWSGWFLSFGGPSPFRPVEDIAFAVARFFQRGGTFQNYYMYHGGTNFDRTSRGPFIATTYDYDAPLDEFGLLRQPKWGHLKDLHKAIKLCEQALVATDPTHSSPGSNLEVSVYRTESGSCAALLANIGKSDATVNFDGKSYSLPAWSVSILPDCKKVVFNTAKVNTVTVIPKFEHQSLKGDANPSGTFDSDWSWVNEPVGISRNDVFTRVGLMEQINTTADRSDYLWYSISINMKGNEPFLESGSQTILHVQSLGHAFHAFINGKLSGSATGSISSMKLYLDFPITLVPGKNKIDLLSLTVGLQNYGPYYDILGAGLTSVSLKGLKNGTGVNLSLQQWTYQVGLKGGELGLASGTSSQWVSQGSLPKKQPLTWYKTKFNAPAGTDPIALVFNGMGKGEAWVNGQSIGRYWPSYFSSNASCSESCSYIGSYDANKCLSNCGRPSQERYHVPRSWLQPTDNTLVVFEETGGDPIQISFAAKKAGSICSHVSESHTVPIDMWTSDSDAAMNSGPTLHLECAYSSETISEIKFASFGTPTGSCGNFGHGSCTRAEVVSIVEKACIGSNSCSIEVSTNTFGDPCMGVTKSLAVEATCS